MLLRLCAETGQLQTSTKDCEASKTSSCVTALIGDHRSFPNTRANRNSRLSGKSTIPVWKRQPCPKFEACRQSSHCPSHTTANLQRLHRQSSVYTDRMYKSPYDPIFGIAEPCPPRYHRRTCKTYSNSYEDSLTPFSSKEDMRVLALASPTGPRVTETRLAYPLQLTDLPSRVNALSRRGATLSAHLAHVASVIELLTYRKVDDF